MSMFSTTAEYALRALTCLAQHHPHPLTTALLAEQTQSPPGYLSKVLQQLGRAGLLAASRGKHGGWEMARQPNDITIFEILAVVDPIRRIQHCPLRLPMHQHQLCPLHRKMDDALAQIEQTFRATTLGDLLNSPGAPVPLCNSLSDCAEAIR